MSKSVLRMVFLLCAVALSAAQTCLGGSATWAESPVSGDWNTAANWLPQTVPNGPSDTAVFTASNITNVATSAIVEVNSLVFDADATQFSVTTAVGTSLTISGTGIINHSQTVQSFSLEVTDETTSGYLFFNSATAGELTLFNNPGGELDFLDASNAGKATFIITGVGARQGHLTFFDSATAAEATIAITGDATATFLDDTTATNALLTTSEGGRVLFSTNSSAGQATLQCAGGTEPGLGGGGVNFDSSSTAAEGNVTLDGAAVAGAVSTDATFSNSATGDTATFVVNGGAEAGAEGATMNFYEDSTADAASITINGGSSGGGGGSLFFFVRSDGGSASIALYSNGQMDIGNHARPGVTIGSLEGNGLVFLGPRTLTIGSNNVSTTFSGVIQDGGMNHGTGGSLTKIGTGALTLSGANTYSGGTTLSAGALVIDNTTSSGTGTGPVQANSGTLGGAGIIAGAVTLGTGSGTGAFLRPSLRASMPVTLTIQSALAFKADSTYICKLNTKKVQADQVIGHGVTIESGAQFNLKRVSNRELPAGQVFTVLGNTGATPIAGTFANLPEGATFNQGRNKFQASYSGGDGNDLTLTVLP